MRRSRSILAALVAAAAAGDHARPALLGAGRARRIRAGGRARRSEGPARRAAPGQARRGADAGRAGQGGQAAAGRAARARRAAGHPAGARDRQVWRHLAARLHRPRRRRERQPHQRLRQAAVLGLHRHRDRALGRARLGAECRRQDLHPVPAQGHEVVGRRAVHRRRFRVLVRGPLLEQGDRADADRRHAAAGQARPRGQDRRHHGPVPVRRAVLPVRGHDGRRHADRRRPVGAAVAEVHLRRLFAQALSVAVPAQEQLGRRGQRQGQGGRLRELGAVPALQEGLVAQSRAADARALEDRPADQHADLGAGAQSLLLGGRHRGQPAALHRPGPAHPGREPRGAEPARRRRRVRPAGAAHRPRQAAGDPREPGEGRLHRPSRPGLQRLGLGAADQPELRRRSRDREVADQRRLPPRLVARARPRPAQRDLLARRRHAGLDRAGRELALQSRARSTAPPGRPTTSTRPTRCSTRSA